jgi:hypothetical protein
MNRSHRIVSVLTLASVVFATTPAIGANASSDDPALNASRHFQRGVKLSEDADWRAALIEFQRAYAIIPNYRVLFDIGQCRYQIRDYPGALTAFQRYLTEGGDQVPPERRVEVVSDIDLLKGRVAMVRIVSATPGATVGIDDASVGTTPLASPIAVSAGRHKIVASKAGLMDIVRYVDLAGEESVDVSLDFGAPAGPSPAKSPTRSLAPAILAFGVAAAGVGVGSYFGVEALENKRELERTCTGNSCPSSSHPAFDAAQRDALVSTVGFAAAVVGAGAGAAYLLFATPRDSERTAKASVLSHLLVGVGSVGAQGNF